MVTAAARSAPAHPPRVDHLLNMARAAFMAHGFEAVSIDALARDAGVSKETIYRYFPNKEALFRAALEAMGQEFATRTEALHRVALPLGDELTELARAVLDSALEGGLLSPLRLAAGVAGTMPEYANDLQTMQWQRMEPIRRALEEHARAKGSAAVVPLELALDFGSLAVGGPSFLLGFAPPEANERDLIPRRVAALFGEGVLRSGHLRDLADASTDTGTECAASPARRTAVAPHIRVLLDVAARHFLELGFERASLLDIGAEARIGRGTLYRHFASKAGLFDAVLRDLAAQVAEEARVPALPLALTDPVALEDALTSFTAAAILTLASPHSLALHRAAIAAAARDPALARSVHDIVRAPWLAPLARWLGHTLHASCPHWLASALIVLALQGNRLIASARSMSPQEATRHARQIARLFLHGYAAALEQGVDEQA